MKLSELKEDEFAKITEIKECNAGKRRLNDLGFCIDEPVNCVFKGAFGLIAVSYTHLDVYKRQVVPFGFVFRLARYCFAYKKIRCEVCK